MTTKRRQKSDADAVNLAALAEMEAKDFAALASSGGGDEARVPVSLAVLRGDGDMVMIGEKSYHLAPFPIKHLERGYQLLAKCPRVLLHEAIAKGDSGDGVAVPLERIAELMNNENALTGSDVEYNAAMVGAVLSFTPRQITAENAADLTQAVVLALSRRHPDLTAEDIEGDLDLATLSKLLRVIFRVNDGIVESFG